MLNIRFTGQFKQDFKRVKSQGFSEADNKELKKLIQLLAEQKPLDPKYLDHPLKGKGFVGAREFHFRPDLLVVYKIRVKEVELLMLRFGSHSELFQFNRQKTLNYGWEFFCIKYKKPAIKPTST